MMYLSSSHFLFLLPWLCVGRAAARNPVTLPYKLSSSSSMGKILDRDDAAWPERMATHTLLRILILSTQEVALVLSFFAPINALRQEDPAKHLLQRLPMAHSQFAFLCWVLSLGVLMLGIIHMLKVSQLSVSHEMPSISWSMTWQWQPPENLQLPSCCLKGSRKSRHRSDRPPPTAMNNAFADMNTTN